MAQTLRTVLTIDMRGFRQGLKRAQKNVRAFGRDIAKPIGEAARKIGRLALAVAGLAAAFGLMGIRAASEMGGMKLRMQAMSSSADDFKQRV
jgi:phage tail tape-measure protein